MKKNIKCAGFHNTEYVKDIFRGGFHGEIFEVEFHEGMLRGPSQGKSKFPTSENILTYKLDDNTKELIVYVPNYVTSLDNLEYINCEVLYFSEYSQKLTKEQAEIKQKDPFIQVTIHLNQTGDNPQIKISF